MKPSIQRRTQVVYYAPTANRTFVTKRAAAKAEARARIKVKYPTELGDEDESGWHWSMLPRADKLLKRYARILAKHIV